MQHKSIIKDKEFILFKDSLFKFYYSTIIILFIYLFKNNYLHLLLELNAYFIYSLFSIFLFYFILLNNFFTLKLFNLYILIKKNINLFNETNWISTSVFSLSNKKIVINKFNLKRNYSTSSYEFVDLTASDNSNNSKDSDINNSEIKNFKKTYKGGYLGYQNMQDFGNVSHLSMAGTNAEQRQYINKEAQELEIKINDYLNDIPENITYSILPVIRSKLINGDYKTVTISDKAIKITKYTSRNLLASKLIRDILRAVFIYDLQGADINLYILDRPWLSEREFKADLTKVTEVLDNQIEKEIYSWSKMSELNNSDKENRLKNYKYRDNFMDNYGTPVLDKNNSLIGYKINEFEYISLITYYNENNLLCNKVSIKDFNSDKLSFEGDAITTWVDTRTPLGFIRELNKDKYYYDKNNCLINVEISYNQPKFPIYKYDTNLSEKIGTIDFETYGTNLGLGHHQVYAAGFSIKDKTELFYIEPLESGEQFINRFFHSILLVHDLNGYTFYIHNLGRFDSVFIIKSLILNKDVTIVPVWKDNSILSL